MDEGNTTTGADIFLESLLARLDPLHTAIVDNDKAICFEIRVKGAHIPAPVRSLDDIHIEASGVGKNLSHALGSTSPIVASVLTGDNQGPDFRLFLGGDSEQENSQQSKQRQDYPFHLPSSFLNSILSWQYTAFLP